MALPQPPFGSAIQGIVSGGATRVVAVWQNWLQLVQNYIFGLTNSGPTSARPTKDLWVGQPFFDTTINVPVYWNGSTWVTSSPSGTVTAVTGTSPIASSGGTTPDISISQANATTNGYLSSTDWNTFNSKQPAGTYVNSVGAVSPVASTGGTAPVISMPAASSSVSGYLTSTDWSSFASARTFINVTAYGVVLENASADAANTAALQAIINANPYATLYFPAGRTYVTSGLTCSTGISFFGNAQTSSAITSTSSTGAVLTITTTTACVFQNITFATNTTRTSDAYVVVSAPTGGEPYGPENSDSVFINCGFLAGPTGIHFVRAAHWRIIDGQFQQQTNAGVIIENQNNLDSGDSFIAGSLFSMASTGVGIVQYTSGGLKVIGSKFLGGTYHYVGQYSTGPGTSSATSILIFTGNSLEHPSSACIALNTSSNDFSQVNISGNQFSVDTAGAVGISTTGTRLYYAHIGGNEIYLKNGATAISIGGGTGITIGTHALNGTSSDNGVGLYNSAEVFVSPQAFNSSIVNRFVAYTANTKFEVGQWRAGSGAYYGPWNGYNAALWISDPIPISITQVFPATPSICIELRNPTSSSAGGVGYLIQSKSPSSFEIRIIAASNSGYVNYEWSAYVAGQ